MRKAFLAAASFAALLSLPSGAIFADAGPSDQILQNLRDKLADLQAKNEAIVAGADGAGIELTDTEIETINANVAEMEKIQTQISAREKTAAVKGQGRKTEPGTTAALSAGRTTINARHNFERFGDFAMAVRKSCISGSTPDQRLLAAASTYGNEGNGTDGGFLVPPDFSKEIMTKVQAEDGLLQRATQLQTGGNSMVIPKDETTPWQSSGGVQVFWEGEGGAAAASKAAFETSAIRLAKLMALVPVSDELLDDAPGLESWLRAKAPVKMASKINTAFYRGTGVGQPLGILKSPSLISVAKETSQPADSILFANVNKMWSRMYAPWRRNAAWYINQDIEPQLNGMAFDPNASSKVPVYLPAGSVANSPYGVLLGRPVIPLEACSTLGDQGDISLVDMSQYWALTKAQGVRTDVSIHLYFDQSLTTFRFIFRLNGQPAWSKAIDPENGTNTRSWAVTLDERA